MDEDKAGGDGLDAVRAELRSLGYLEGPLERYLLRDLFSRPRLLAPALRAALRATWLGAPALGLVFGLGLLHSSPTLAGRAADAVVAVVAATLLATPVAFALLLGCAVVGLVASPRRIRAAARGVELVVGAAALAWLSSWWWLTLTHEGDRGPMHLLLFAPFCLVSILLGRLAGLTAAALGADRRASRDAVPPPPDGSAKAHLRPVKATGLAQAAGALGITMALLAAAVAALLVRARPPQASPIVPRAGVPRVVVLAVDGLALEDLEHGARDLAALAQESARGSVFPLARATEPIPPVVWTTVATGRNPGDHGVRSLLARQLPGVDTAFPGGYGVSALGAVAMALLPRGRGRELIDERARREKAFWEVADEAALPSVVVNWWATYPARSTHGVVISDRAYAALAAGLPLDGEVAPASLAIAPAVGAGGEAGVAGSAGEAAGLADVDGAFASDHFHATTAIEMAEASGARLVALYLQGLDVAWSAGAGPLGSEAQGREVYYGFLDDVVRLARFFAGEDGVLVVIGDPGRARPRLTGFLMLAGGPVLRRERSLQPARLEQIAPSILVCLGLPLSRELSSAPLLEALDRGFLARNPARHVASYGRLSAGDEAEGRDASSAAATERLRSLGYLN